MPDRALSSHLLVSGFQDSPCEYLPQKAFSLFYLLINGHVLMGTTNIENGIMPPPPDGQWARPEP